MAKAAQNMNKSDDLERLRAAFAAAIEQAEDSDRLESVRVAISGKNGQLTALMKKIGEQPPETRREYGAQLNIIRNEVEIFYAAKKEKLAGAELQARLSHEAVDVSLSPRPQPATSPTEGRVHPISQTIDEIIGIFASMGFALAKGPDIENEYYNFEALNLPSSHPARDMQATFFLPSHGEHKTVLRTQTSPVQIRTMMSQKPPIRIIAPGRTYRCDYDQTHTPMFHQVEGLVIDEAVHMGHLKGCLMDFLRAFFGIADLPLRFRPSYFPFTEPSAEIDIGCQRPKNNKDGELKLGNFGDWLEIGGSGMVHPNVLRNCGIDPDHYQGFAFGMGIERMAMLKYGIPDLRTFFDADLRWLKHYGFMPLDIPNAALEG